MEWTVVDIALGAGTGEGDPLSPGKMSPDSSSPATPSPPALRAPPPPPPGGEGSHGDIPHESRARGAALTPVSREKERVGPNPVLPRDLPVHWTVVAIAMGRGQYVGIRGTSRLPGCKPPDSVKKDQYFSSGESAGN